MRLGYLAGLLPQYIQTDKLHLPPTYEIEDISVNVKNYIQNQIKDLVKCFMDFPHTK